MNAPQSHELRMLESRDGSENANLVGVLEFGLKSDHVEQRPQPIVLAKLHHRIRFLRSMRIGQTKWLHRSVAQSLAPAFGHHLNRQAPVEVRCFFPRVKRRLVARNQCVDKRVVVRARQRTVDVVRAGAAGTGFVVARLKPGNRHIDAVAIHDWRNGIEERERILACSQADGLRERWRRKRTCRDDDVVPIGWRNANLLAPQRDQRVTFNRFHHGRSKMRHGQPRALRRRALGWHRRPA